MGCPAPQAVASFTTILSGVSVADLANLNVDNIKTAMTASSNWGDDPLVEVVAVVKIGLTYTLDVAITSAQCVAAVASTYSVDASMVECGAGTAAASGSNATTVATTTAASRRLQEVMDVTISFTDVTASHTAATDSQESTTSDAFVAALAAGANPVTVTVTEVSAAAVTVELTFTVTSDAAISEPTAAVVEGAATAGGLTSVTIEVSGFTTAFDRMPCSESDICDGNLQLIDGAEDVGCEASVCAAEETDRCCTARPAVGSAHRTCAVGSLLSLLTLNFF